MRFGIELSKNFRHNLWDSVLNYSRIFVFLWRTKIKNSSCAKGGETKRKSNRYVCNEKFRYIWRWERNPEADLGVGWQRMLSKILGYWKRKKKNRGTTERRHHYIKLKIRRKKEKKNITDYPAERRWKRGRSWDRECGRVDGWGEEAREAQLIGRFIFIGCRMDTAWKMESRLYFSFLCRNS